MTNASWKLTNWLSEYAQLMRALRTESGCVFGGLCQLFELYLLHIYHTFSDISLAELSSPNRQQQVLTRLTAGFSCRFPTQVGLSFDMPLNGISTCSDHSNQNALISQAMRSWPANQ